MTQVKELTQDMAEALYPVSHIQFQVIYVPYLFFHGMVAYYVVLIGLN